ncbi:MAG TPA: GIY-YIG nuclease family protein [Patescibacteria group bacterium]|nr:GIY-YIG nuclease family protein [Patescibacteria group bacterium]
MVDEKEYGYVYMLANKKCGTLYIGSTKDLNRRIYQHKHNNSNFTKKYETHILVWFEQTGSLREARIKEKQMKKWNRAWKLRRIWEMNPKWIDLSLF